MPYRVAAVLLMLAFAFPANAAMLVWDALNPAWDDLDQSGLQSFANVDGSGIDIDVHYTDNMFSNNSVPNIYHAPHAPSPEIEGTLRFTNDRDGILEPTTVTIVFSEAVFIDAASAVSLSLIVGLQENLVVEALDAQGNLVAATSYGTNTPALVQLDIDGDASYRTRGTGAQEDNLYGDTTYSWTDAAIKSLSFTILLTDVDQTTLVMGWSSQGIGNITFTPVPEPNTALLLAGGLLGIAIQRRRRR
jgi:hypothetical protein